MALGGIAPLLIFTFDNSVAPGVANVIKGIPLIGDLISSNIGIPIPVYLDEKFTGLMIDSESRSLDFTTDIEKSYKEGVPSIVSQRLENSLLTVAFECRRDAMIISALITFMELISQKLVGLRYNVSWIGPNTMVLNGLLHGFQVQQGRDDTLARITLQIMKKDLENAKPSDPVLPKITGATPIPAPPSFTPPAPSLPSPIPPTGGSLPTLPSFPIGGPG